MAVRTEQLAALGLCVSLSPAGLHNEVSPLCLLLSGLPALPAFVSLSCASPRQCLCILCVCMQALSMLQVSVHSPLPYNHRSLHRQCITTRMQVEALAAALGAQAGLRLLMSLGR